MNRRILVVLLTIVTSICRVSAGVVVFASDDPSDTVKFLRAKADLVVVAIITNDILSIGSAPIDPQAFYPRPYAFTATVDAVLFGHAPEQKQIRADVSRIERTVDPLTIKPGKYILFLKRPTQEGKPWTGADVLFGAVHYDAGLAAALTNQLDFIIQER